MVKQYDLEDRTFEFAKRCRDFVKKIPRTISNIEYGKQLIRSSGSVGANYIEANESLSKKDFIMRAKICKKESKESRYWLKLVEAGMINEQQYLIQESTELMKMFGAMIENALKGDKDKK
ncbi:four helix bundle protein [Patescibacteria group bacterium]|nr:four helix bundle protein [Candidatus Falkowbacteria bacterium]MBU3905443.1 four helix bundle protein [Patescibacteria group bacterium]MCG2697898.1 four helix bundle protein [Candidatus Parcubacteria bacterium]MBU4014623.1 four helix bundle protein [Patescibacteria group bacterium]MBU4027103.1 four helix bundle protein [Patescibacteria group bacterium]